MRIDWKAVALVVLILVVGIGHKEVKEILMTGRDMLLSGIARFPLEEELITQPFETPLVDEGIKVEEWGKEDSIDIAGELIVLSEEIEIKKISLNEVEAEIRSIEKEVEIITFKVEELEIEQKHLTVLQYRVQEISRQVELISQTINSLASEPSIS